MVLAEVTSRFTFEFTASFDVQFVLFFVDVKDFPEHSYKQIQFLKS